MGMGSTFTFTIPLRSAEWVSTLRADELIGGYTPSLSLPHAAMRPILDALREPYEVVAVDDGSTNRPFAMLTGLGRVD